MSDFLRDYLKFLNHVLLDEFNNFMRLLSSELPKTWISEMSTVQLVVTSSACSVLLIYIMTFYLRKNAKQKTNIERKIEKIENIRKRQRSLITREAFLCSLYSGRKNIIFETWFPPTILEQLQKNIQMIEDAIKKKKEFTAEMKKQIKPFVKLIVEARRVPKEIELKDARTLLLLVAVYLEEKELILGRMVKEGVEQSIDIMLHENLRLKEENKQLSNIIQEILKIRKNKKRLKKKLNKTLKEIMDVRIIKRLNQEQIKKLQKELKIIKAQRSPRKFRKIKDKPSTERLGVNTVQPFLLKSKYGNSYESGA